MWFTQRRPIRIYIYIYVYIYIYQFPAFGCRLCGILCPFISALFTYAKKNGKLFTCRNICFAFKNLTHVITSLTLEFIKYKQNLVFLNKLNIYRMSYLICKVISNTNIYFHIRVHVWYRPTNIKSFFCPKMGIIKFQQNPT